MARQLGLPQGQFRVIAAQAHTAVERHAASMLAFERATTGFGWSRPGRIALLDETVYTILPGSDLDPARGWVHALRGALPADVTLTAGIGAGAVASDLPASSQEADEALALHRTCGAKTALIAYDESWTEIMLQRLRTAAAAQRRPAVAQDDRDHAPRPRGSRQAVRHAHRTGDDGLTEPKTPALLSQTMSFAARTAFLLWSAAAELSTYNKPAFPDCRIRTSGCTGSSRILVANAATTTGHRQAGSAQRWSRRST